MHRKKHYLRYIGYLNSIKVFETITYILSIFWTIVILILNTGDDTDREENEWYADENSLQTTILITFSFIIGLTIFQFMVQLCRMS